jgi:hypothetical protein
LTPNLELQHSLHTKEVRVKEFALPFFNQHLLLVFRAASNPHIFKVFTKIIIPEHDYAPLGSKDKMTPTLKATVNQHPPVHHPLDAQYYSVVDEPQLS